MLLIFQIFSLFLFCGVIFGQRPVFINRNLRYVELSPVKKLSWQNAANRCRTMKMELCLRKDLCKVIGESYLLRPPIKASRKNKYVPILDKYNDWLYVGTRKLRQCRRITELDGPPSWGGNNCSDAAIEKSSKKIEHFCISESGFYCCRKTEKSTRSVAHETSVYVRSRMEHGNPYYSFSLDESSSIEEQYMTDKAPWRDTGNRPGDVKKFSLMSEFVEGQFEDPIFFCKRSFTNSDGLTTTIHTITDKWCLFGSRLNFYLYGSLSQPSGSHYEKLLVYENGTGSGRYSRVSVKERSNFTSKFNFYAPMSKQQNPVVLSNVAENACINKTEVITSSSGVINSPNFPKKFNSGNKQVCRWRIRAPARNVIRITFKALDLGRARIIDHQALDVEGFLGARKSGYNFNKDCLSDRVEIEGYGTFCEGNLPPSFVTIHDEVDITFFGGKKSSKTGFSLVFETISPQKDIGVTRVREDGQRYVTWSLANQTCAFEGKTLCRAEDICSFDKRPFYGVLNGDQWAPVLDAYNEWVQIGRGNVQTCSLHNQAFGPPRWGILEGACQESNMTQPCPIRENLYCCNLEGSEGKLPFSEPVTVLIYSTVQNGIKFSKYLRKDIDTATTFDNLRIWTPNRKVPGDFSSIKLQSQLAPGFSKVIYFCQRNVTPSIGKLTHAYAMLLQPCQTKGWAFLYHLYAMNSRQKGALQYFVGVFERIPHHTRLRSKEFPEDFQSEEGYILFASGAKADPTEGRNEETEDDSACDGETSTLVAPTVLESPGYPASYDINIECRWLITLPAEDKRKGRKLRITIMELSLEDPVDILSVLEIDEEQDPIANTTKESIFRRREFTGMVGQVSMETTKSFRLFFKSDNSVSEKGFMIEATIVSEECGDHVRMSGDVITSPNHPLPYPSGSKCKWTIEAPSTDYDIKLEFESFDLTPDTKCSDKILILDKNSSRVYCETQKPNGRISVNASYLEITFVSQSGRKRKNGEGFSLRVYFVENILNYFPQCGVQTVPFGSKEAASDRIIGGIEAKEGNFPWMAQITSPWSFCGGTLVSNKRVLTAAHCFINQITASHTILNGDPREARIIVGRHRRNISSPGEQIFNMSSISYHGEYLKIGMITFSDDGKFGINTFSYNDILMIELGGKVVFTPTVKPICLPSQDAFVGDTCYLAGWGSLDVDGIKRPKALRYARAPVLDSSLCNTLSGMQNSVFNNSLCAGYPEGGPGMCWGDSGGPLLCRGRYGNFYINGIISWSIGCGGKNAPGVYVRLWNFYDWMMNIIRKDEKRAR